MVILSAIKHKWFYYQFRRNMAYEIKITHDF